MGSCKDSVIVEEPVPVPISGQHLCSEFALQSVPDQQPCSELSCPEIESTLDFAGFSEANECGKSVTDGGSNFLSAGNITLMSQDVGALGSESDDSVPSGGCLDENHMSGEDCLKEDMTEAEDGSGNSIGDCELPVQDMTVASLDGGGCLNENKCDADSCTAVRTEKFLQQSSPRAEAEDDTEISAEDSEFPGEAMPLVESGCLNESQCEVVARSREGDGGCMKVSKSEDEDGIPLDVIPLASLVNDDHLIKNHTVIDACHVEKSGDCLPDGEQEDESGLGNSTGAPCELPSENIHVAGVINTCCLNDNNSDFDPCIKEVAEEFLQERRPQVEDDVRKPTGNQMLPVEVIPAGDFAATVCLNEDQSDFVASKECVAEIMSATGADDIRNLTGESKSSMEVASVADLANEDCLNENHSDIDTCSTRSNGLLLKGRPEGESCMNENLRNSDGFSTKLAVECSDKEGVEDLLEDCKSGVLLTAGMATGVCLDEIQSDVDVCSEERSGECLQESEPQRDALGNIAGYSDLSVEVKPVVGFPMNCGQQDEQKDDRSFDCFALDIKEVLEEKVDAFAILPSDFCEQESTLQDCESSILIPLNGGLDNLHEQTEQDLKSVELSSLVNTSVVTVSSAESDVDLCKDIVSLHPCESTLDVSHSGDVDDCDLKIDQNNSTGILPKEMISVAVEAETIDLSNQLLLSSVQEGEQIERSVHALTNPGKEFLVENNDVSCGIKVDVYNLKENAWNDKPVSLQSNLHSSVIDDGSSKRSSAPDQLDRNSQETSKYGSAVDSCGQTDNQLKGIDGVESVIISSSYQKSGGKSRSRRKTPTKKAPRKGKKTAKGPQESISSAVFKVKRKRSTLPKLARPSAWGSLVNMTQLFEHSNGLEALQVSNKVSQKSKGRKNNGKRNKDGATARAQGSKKSRASTTGLRLKVTIGKGVHQSLPTVPELVDTSKLFTATSCSGNELQEYPKLADGKIEDWDKSEVSMQSRCFSSNQEKAASFPDASVQEAQLVNNDLHSSVAIEKSVEDSRDDYFGMSNVTVDASGRAAENRCKDPGTSPDSEVINLIPDAQADSRSLDDFHGTVTFHEDPAASGGFTSSKSGKKNNKLSGSGSSKRKPRPAKTNRAKPLKQYGRKKNPKNGIHAGENLDLSVGATAASNSSSGKETSLVEPSLVSDETALKPSEETLEAEMGAKADKMDCDLDTGVGLSKLDNFKKSKTKGHKLSKGKPKGSDPGVERVNARCKGEPKQRSVSKKKINKKNVCEQAASNVESLPDAENHMVDAGTETNNSYEKITSADLPYFDQLPSALGEQYIPPRNAWVRCDGCHKWRRIPAELADSIEESKCTWTCKDNVDTAFADCLTPQEKSNAEINAELELSDASGEEDASGAHRTSKGFDCRRPREMQETVTCTTIRTNQFLHRNRKTQNIDEIMVCHCKPSSDGRLGCRDDCLNRMLNIECVPGACPCGELCSNQQFQKRKYAKLGKFQCGKKGYGLKLLEDVPKGKFLIEYVGEVLDMAAYEARQKEYAVRSHKHFYFMTLNGSEVIDACVKGNKGRFINHSCEPNCQTEKWMVNGEICIGLFALRDIKKGEEVTFDYNYVRVFGAAAKKCYCLSQQCRGYIGGDPLSGDVIIQSDSDEDYREPLLRRQNGRSGERNGVIRRPRFSADILKPNVESVLVHSDEKDKGRLALGQPETTMGKEDSISHPMSDVSPVHDALETVLKEEVVPSDLPLEISQETEDSLSELVSSVQQEGSLAEETPVKELSTSLSDSAAKGKPMPDNVHDKKLSSKGHAKVKTSRSSTIKKTEVIKSSPTNSSKPPLDAIKPETSLMKPKKVMEGSFGSHFEAVEEKLNELLDPDGGISKRKDAARGYLKLLLLTSASGGTANAIQRNRDLSMILDALLKTRSRLVLNDIINKNGLRMLHKLINQYRRDFKKIPILRKLLKVLEYLALRDILTLEHIKEGPPHKGMESFRESFLSLTEHEDKKVHQIARNFRDRWIPKYLRRPNFMDRDDYSYKTEFSRSSNYNRYSPVRNNESDRTGKPSEATDAVNQSEPATPSVDVGSQEVISTSCVTVPQSSGTRTRKRKSRWDQPAETITDLSSFQPKEQKTEHKQIESYPVPGSAELSVESKDKLNTQEINGSRFVNVSCHVDIANTSQDDIKDVLDDVPPGFSSPLKPTPTSNCTSDNVVGHVQEKFNFRLPISYGIPLPIIHRFGTPHEEIAGSWVIAPGMPFHPFPPLPVFPRDKTDPTPSGDSSNSAVNQPAGEAAVHDSCLSAASDLNDCSPSTTTDQPGVQVPSTDNQILSKRARETSNDLGTRYFKQQKWNNTKLRPPGHWSRRSWGWTGDSKGEANSSAVGNVTNDHRSTYCSEDISCQQPEHHTQH